MSQVITLPACVIVTCPRCKRPIIPGEQVVIEGVETVHLACIKREIKVGPSEYKVDWMKYD